MCWSISLNSMTIWASTLLLDIIVMKGRICWKMVRRIQGWLCRSNALHVSKDWGHVNPSMPQSISFSFPVILILSRQQAQHQSHTTGAWALIPVLIAAPRRDHAPPQISSGGCFNLFLWSFVIIATHLTSALDAFRVGVTIQRSGPAWPGVIQGAMY